MLLRTAAATPHSTYIFDNFNEEKKKSPTRGKNISLMSITYKALRVIGNSQYSYVYQSAACSSPRLHIILTHFTIVIAM